MRILAVLPHYFGPSHPESSLPAVGSYIEPLGRIAALSEAIVGLHRHFGPNRHMYDGSPMQAAAPAWQIDIVVLAVRGHELTGELGLDPGVIEVRYVDCKPPWIPFEAQNVFRERLGQYDFYCFMEDDLIIHDPAFFEKLSWFVQHFGTKSLLMPVRCEIPATGTPAKVIADIDMAESFTAPFRRPGQREEIEAVWNGQSQSFALAKNPHAGSFFLTREQMDYWVTQPSYGDGDASWVGPMESAGTYSVGRAFDIYKPLRPDPFFLEVHHYGVRYASQYPPQGRRYGDPPLLAIAQNAMRAALDPAKLDATGADSDGTDGPSFSRLARRWIAQGSAVELRGQLDALQAQMRQQTGEAEARAAADSEVMRRHAEELKQFQDRNEELKAGSEALRQANDQLVQKMTERDAEVAQERWVRSHSLRWLIGALRAELLRRWRGGPVA